MALIGLHLCEHLRVAWTDVGDVGVVRRPALTKIDRFCQGLSHLGLDPVGLLCASTKIVFDLEKSKDRAMGGSKKLRK